MKKLLLIACLFISVSLFAQQTNKTLLVNGVQRSYIQFLPNGFNPQTEHLPTVLILHGINGTNTDMTAAGFNLIADTARIIVLYPQGVLNDWNMTSWNNGTLLGSTADDLGFMNQLMDSAILGYQGDPTRVYVTGFSMGSIMSYHVACHLNERVAAIGCMAGTMSTPDLTDCNTTYKTPVIHLHGTADGTVPYDSEPLPSLSLVPETINFWKNVHGCDASADSTRIPDIAADGITVDRLVYDNCDPVASLELWKLNNADHIYLQRPINDFTEGVEVWRFFRQWAHTNPAAAGLNDADADAFQVYPNPSTGILSIEAKGADRIQIYNAQGNLVHETDIQQGLNKVDLKDLGTGIFLIQSLQAPTRSHKIIVQ
jgi:polyhydroxybutyrate depolymerase